MNDSYGILWDMDGVLADTGELHYISWKQTLDEVSLPFDREIFRKTFGMNNNGILTNLLGQPPEPTFLEQISNRKEGLFRQWVKGNVKLLPGVTDWLVDLRSGGFRQAVASSAPIENVETLVDELSIREYFSVLLSGYDLPGKPDPATFLKAANLLKVAPDRCVVVEDAIAGVEAAKRAGMKCIAVTTTNPAHTLRSSDVIVERLDQLPKSIFETLLRITPKNS
jgi:HAD superfamily hydrolase (TIGR01509 family)